MYKCWVSGSEGVLIKINNNSRRFYLMKSVLFAISSTMSRFSSSVLIFPLYSVQTISPKEQS